MAEKKSVKIKAEDLIKGLNLGNLPDKKQAELLREMANVVYDRILLRIVGNLTEDETAELNKLLAKNNQKKIFEFLEKKNPDFAGLLKKEIARFEDEMLKNARPE